MDERDHTEQCVRIVSKSGLICCGLSGMRAYPDNEGTEINIYVWDPSWENVIGSGWWEIRRDVLSCPHWVTCLLNDDRQVIPTVPLTNPYHSRQCGVTDGLLSANGGIICSQSLQLSLLRCLRKFPTLSCWRCGEVRENKYLSELLYFYSQWNLDKSKFFFLSPTIIVINFEK